MADGDLLALAERIMPAVEHLERACTDAVMAMVPADHKREVIHATKSEWDRQQGTFDDRDAFYAALMPDERAAIRLMHAAYERLKKLDWSDAIYCPKDGSEFDVIEPGSTGVHSCRYEGEWPAGSWWVYADGDAYPSRPILYRRTEAEKARWAALRARAHRSDDHG